MAGNRVILRARIKHLYELYLLRTLKGLACGHNLGRTRYRKYAALVASSDPSLIEILIRKSLKAGTEPHPEGKRDHHAGKLSECSGTLGRG